MSQALNRFRVDITLNTNIAPIGMNSIKYLGNSRAAAERAFNSIRAIQPDKPLLLSEWSVSSSDYIALDSYDPSIGESS